MNVTAQTAINEGGSLIFDTKILLLSPSSLAHTLYLRPSLPLLSIHLSDGMSEQAGEQAGEQVSE